jgi:hypothetical protein
LVPAYGFRQETQRHKGTKKSRMKTFFNAAFLCAFVSLCFHYPLVVLLSLIQATAALQYDIVSRFHWRRKVGFAEHFPQIYFRGPAHLRDRDVIRTPFKRAFGAFSDSLERHVHPRNQYTKRDHQPDHVSLDHSLDAFIEAVEFP